MQEYMHTGDAFCKKNKAKDHRQQRGEKYKCHWQSMSLSKFDLHAIHGQEIKGANCKDYKVILII